MGRVRITRSQQAWYVQHQRKKRAGADTSANKSEAKK